MECLLKAMDNQPDHPRVQLLTPVYNEEESLPLYERKVEEVLLSQTDYDFHVLFIEDGSTDDSWKVIREICARNPRFSAIRLSRNFGSHIALSAGFTNTSADVVATLACDLQDPPEVILEFLQKWRAGAKIVWGRRRSRDDGWARLLASNALFTLLRRFAMPVGSKFTTGSFLLVDKRVAECFRQFQECNRITFALVAWTGFDQEVVDYDRKKRLKGISGWNFRKMVKTMYDAFIGFSLIPIRLMTLAGITAFFLTFVLSVYLLAGWFTGHPAPGWTSQMLVLSVFFGIQFLIMGLMGEYLYRIYTEVIRRPLFFISEKIDTG